MSSVFWIWLVVVLKIPVAIILWMIWRIAKDTPEQVVSDREDDSTIRVNPGPRTRGPHSGNDIAGVHARRRGDAGHRHTAAGRGRTGHRAGR